MAFVVVDADEDENERRILRTLLVPTESDERWAAEDAAAAVGGAGAAEGYLVELLRSLALSPLPSSSSPLRRTAATCTGNTHLHRNPDRPQNPVSETLGKESRSRS